MDAGIRSLRSDNEAAHLRLFHKVFNSSDTSIQHRVFKSLPDNHPWLQRGVQRTVALTTENDNLISALHVRYEHGDNEPETPPEINDPLNVAMRPGQGRYECSRQQTCVAVCKKALSQATKPACAMYAKRASTYAPLQEWAETLAPAATGNGLAGWPSAEGLIIPPHILP
jgi:hypothetical protein